MRSLILAIGEIQRHSCYLFRGLGASMLPAVLLLSRVAVLWLGLSILVVLRPEEIDCGDPILYDHAARVARGEALCLPLGQPCSIASYTPLYYAAAASLHHSQRAQHPRRQLPPAREEAGRPPQQPATPARTTSGAQSHGERERRGGSILDRVPGMV
jgi:hypothetical protein